MRLVRHHEARTLYGRGYPWATRNARGRPLSGVVGGGCVPTPMHGPDRRTRQRTTAPATRVAILTCGATRPTTCSSSAGRFPSANRTVSTRSYDSRSFDDLLSWPVNADNGRVEERRSPYASARPSASEPPSAIAHAGATSRPSAQRPSTRLVGIRHLADRRPVRGHAHICRVEPRRRSDATTYSPIPKQRGPVAQAGKGASRCMASGGPSRPDPPCGITPAR